MNRKFLTRSNNSPGTPTRAGGSGAYLIRAEEAPPIDSSRDLQAVQSFLRRRRWTILGAGLVTLIAVAISTFMIPKTYESSSTFLVEKRNPQSDTPALAVLERMGSVESIETETQLLRSRRVVEPVVDKLDLHVGVELPGGDKVRPAEFFPSFEATGSAQPGTYVLTASSGGVTVREEETEEIIARSDNGDALQFAGLTLSLPQIDQAREYVVDVAGFPVTIERVQGRIEASAVDREANLVSLNCEGPTAASAHDLCAAVQESYMDLRGELQRAEATTTAEVLTGQVAEVEQRLKTAEDSLRVYRTQNQVIAPEARAVEETRNLAAFRAQREQVEAERAALAGLIRETESGAGGTSRYRNLASYPTLMGSGNVTGLLSSLNELEDRRAELTVTRTERNPDVVAVDQRIEAIERQILSMATSYEDALSRQIGTLNSAAGRTAGQMLEIPGQQVETGRLERQVALLDDLYRRLQTRLREAEVAQAVSLPSVRIVDSASIPTQPAWPNVPLMLALGLFLGLGFGLVLAVYQERSDTRIRGRDELERDTGVAVLSMIPRLSHPGPVLPVAIPAGHSGNGGGDRGALILPAERSWEQEVALESFRSVLADINFAADRIEGGSLRSVSITSTQQGEGKTFTACNLALTRANQGARTLLIDADFRAKGVARFFGVRSRPGLSEVLAGTVEAHDAWHQLRVDDTSDLWVLPAGSMDPKSTRLLHTDAFSELLARLEPSFDLVIVDTPPLNLLADAARVAANVDAVMVVVRGGMTDRQALDMTMERLERANGRIVGILLNDVDIPEHYTSYSAEMPDVG